MPKRSVAQSETELHPPALPGWCATGLSVAVIGGAAVNGVGTLCAAVIVAVVIYALARLHRHAPQSPSTGDLVGSTLGGTAGRITSVLQLTGYTVFSANSATDLGFAPLWLGVSDPEAMTDGWLFPALSLAVVVAATLVVALPTRIVGAVAAVLAFVGLLALFYVALAVAAKVAAGTAPVPVAAPAFDGTLLLIAAAVPLAFGLAGFESPTTVSRRLQSVGRPLTAAVAVVVLGAATTLLAVNVGTDGGFHLEAANLSLVASEMFGPSGGYWTLFGAACLGAAAMLAATWAAARVCGRLFGTGTMTLLLLAAVIGVLAVTLCFLRTDVGRLPVLVPALLLLVVYLLVAEANSRVDGPSAATQAPRVVMAVALAGAVLIPLRAHFASPWPAGITAAVIAVVAGAALVRRDAQRSQPHPRR